jgi:hypothetical protein
MLRERKAMQAGSELSEGLGRLAWLRPVDESEEGGQVLIRKWNAWAKSQKVVRVEAHREQVKACHARAEKQ